MHAVHGGDFLTVVQYSLCGHVVDVVAGGGDMGLLRVWLWWNLEEVSWIVGGIDDEVGVVGVVVVVVEMI